VRRGRGPRSRPSDASGPRRERRSLHVTWAISTPPRHASTRSTSRGVPASRHRSTASSTRCCRGGGRWPTAKNWPSGGRAASRPPADVKTPGARRHRLGHCHRPPHNAGIATPFGTFGRTLEAYRHDLRGFFQWAADNHLEVLKGHTPAHRTVPRLDGRPPACRVDDRPAPLHCVRLLPMNPAHRGSRRERTSPTTRAARRRTRSCRDRP
jgi:hypothetical protein